jgi:hypothetical protein
MDFDSDGIRKKTSDAVKEKIRARLADAGLADRVKITFTDDADGFPSGITFSGSEEDVAKAKQAFGKE